MKPRYRMMIAALVLAPLVGWAPPARAADVGAGVGTRSTRMKRRREAARRQAIKAAIRGEAELRKSVRVFQQKYLVKSKRLELLLGGAASIGDALVTTYNADAGLLFHLTDQFAFGVTGSKAFAAESDNFKAIQRDFGLFPERSYLQGTAFLELQYSPVFGKFSSFGLAVLQMDAYLLAGAGAVRTSTTQDYKPAGQLGVGVRIHVFRALTLALEVRDMMFMEQFIAEKRFWQHWMGGIKIGIWIPPTFKYRYQR